MSLPILIFSFTLQKLPHPYPQSGPWRFLSSFLLSIEYHHAMLVSSISGCNTGIGRYARFVANSFDAENILFKIKEYEEDSCFQTVVKTTPLDLVLSYYFYKYKKFFAGKKVFFSSPDLVNNAKYAESAIATVHDIFPFRYHVKMFYKQYFERMLKHISDATAIITNSFYTKKELESAMEKFDVPSVATHVVHFGVMGLPKRDHETARKNILTSFGIDEGKRIVLNVANAQERKNLKEIPEIKKVAGKDFVFITVGHNNTYGDVVLERISDELMSTLMAGADVCLSTSIDEGFNLPLIECAFYGTPSVAKDIIVHRELSQYQKLFLYTSLEEAVEMINNASYIRVDFSDYFSEDRVKNDLRNVLGKYGFT